MVQHFVCSRTIFTSSKRILAIGGIVGQPAPESSDTTQSSQQEHSRQKRRCQHHPATPRLSGWIRSQQTGTHHQGRSRIQPSLPAPYRMRGSSCAMPERGIATRIAKRPSKRSVDDSR